MKKQSIALGYDTTKGQILVYPSFTMVKKEDPLTCFYPDFCPLESKVIGVDFLCLGVVEKLDLAYSERITRMRLIPVASSRQRILNAIKRRWKRLHDSLKPSRFEWAMDGFEHISLCGFLYKYPDGHLEEKKYSINYASCRKSCLKPRSLEIGDGWLALVKASKADSNLRQQLIDVLLHTTAESVSRTKRSFSDLNAQVQPCKTKSLRNVEGKLTEDPLLPTQDMKLCVEYPGILKRDALSKVSFYWAVQGKPEEPESPLEDTPLKIDTVKNKSVYLLPPDSDSISALAIFSSISRMLDHISSDSILVQPLKYSEPAWSIEIERQKNSPTFLESDAHLDTLVPKYSELFDNPGKFPEYYSLSKVVDEFALQSQSIMQKGHAIFKTFSFFFELGQSLF